VDRTFFPDTSTASQIFPVRQQHKKCQRTESTEEQNGHETKDAMGSVRTTWLTPWLKLFVLQPEQSFSFMGHKDQVESTNFS